MKYTDIIILYLIKSPHKNRYCVQPIACPRRECNRIVHLLLNISWIFERFIAVNGLPTLLGHLSSSRMFVNETVLFYCTRWTFNLTFWSVKFSKKWTFGQILSEFLWSVLEQIPSQWCLWYLLLFVLFTGGPPLRDLCDLCCSANHCNLFFTFITPTSSLWTIQLSCFFKIPFITKCRNYRQCMFVVCYIKCVPWVFIVIRNLNYFDMTHRGKWVQAILTWRQGKHVPQAFRRSLG